MKLGGLSKIFIEWTSRCDKTHLCGMCGHQAHPGLQRGDMSLALMEKIRDQLPLGIECAFHKDGDPLAYPYVKDALTLFEGFVRIIVTHGLNLRHKYMEIIGRAETVVVSVFRADPDQAEQLVSLQTFATMKRKELPRLIIKVVGDMNEDELGAYRAIADEIIHRRLHVPINNSKYAQGNPPIPESGICQDLLHVPSISWDGTMSLCNRIDIEKDGLIGNLNNESLESIWHGRRRLAVLDAHLLGNRQEIRACADCQYYGIPAS